MTVDDRENARSGDLPRPLHAEHAAIPQTGDAGVVETHGGDTSLGTTPIGLGSVGPVQQHQRATEMIMGQTDAAGGPATAADTDDRGMEPVGRTQQAGGKTQGGLGGTLKQLTKRPIVAIVLGLVVAAIAVAAFVIRRRQ